MAAVRTGPVLLVLLVLTGCADSGSEPSAAATTPVPARSSAPVEAPAAAPGGTDGPPPDAAPPVDPGPAEQRCDHPTQGYSVAFPSGWQVATQDGIEPCAFFHPGPLTLPQHSEATGVAVRVDVRDVPFDQARQDLMAEGEQAAEEQTVADRAAVRLEGVLTEELLLPAGTRTTTWLVELDTGTLLLTTDDAGADDYEAAVEVLDTMARTLEIP